MQQQIPNIELDDKSNAGFIEYFNKLPKDENVIRFFDRKAYYTTHGDAATFIAREYYKTTSVIKTLSGNHAQKLSSLAINRNLFEQIARDLLLARAQYHVQIYEGHGSSWTLLKSASPGNVTALEDELYRNADVSDMPILMSTHVVVKDGDVVVGIAYVDSVQRHVGVCEIAVDSQWSQLEGVCVQLGAKECVCMEDSGATSTSHMHKQLADVLQKCNIMVTRRPKSHFSTTTIDQDLGKLTGCPTIEQLADVLDRKIACSALAALIQYNDLTRDVSSHSITYTASVHDSRAFMRIDTTAQRALHVFPPPGGSGLSAGGPGGSFSLAGLMTRGRTPMGKRLVKQWLKQPLIRVEDIGVRHDVVQCLVDDVDVREQLRQSHLRGMPDIPRLVRKIQRGAGGLQDLCALYRASSKAAAVSELLGGGGGDAMEVDGGRALLAQRYGSPLCQQCSEQYLGQFQQLVESSIDFNLIPEQYVIAQHYDPTLEELYQQKQEVEERIADLAEEISKDLNLQLDKQLKYEWHRGGGGAGVKVRCLRITPKDEKTKRKQLQKYIILETRKDGTKFTSRQMKQAAENLCSIDAQYQQAQQDLVAQLMSVAATYSGVFFTVSDLLSELDALAGFADLAVASPSGYCRPEMTNDSTGDLVIRGLRHAVLEAQADVEYISNNVEMKHGESAFVIVTGPNMGGKSTYIRQVGVAVLMAQVGSFIPAASAQLPVRDAIFARIGAGDNMARGVSTFMAEMLEAATILRGISTSSLVIIDELGRGTSTCDGFGLAWAISEHMVDNVGCLCLFATHFHELTALRGAAGVQNLHVGTEVVGTEGGGGGGLRMTYKIHEGACDQSFGIHVAEHANFPGEVVEMARKKLGELEGACAPGAWGGPGEGGNGGKGGEAAAEEAIRQFLEKFQEIPLEQLSPESGYTEAEGKLKELIQQGEGNCVLQQVLSEVGAV